MSYRNSVPVDELQRAFLDSGLAASEVARRCGWMAMNRGRKRPDQSRFLRLIGLRDYSPATRANHPKTHLRVDIALKICEAMNIDPMDVGL